MMAHSVSDLDLILVIFISPKHPLDPIPGSPRVVLMFYTLLQFLFPSQTSLDLIQDLQASLDHALEDIAQLQVDQEKYIHRIKNLEISLGNAIDRLRDLDHIP
jgi:hypothetical protein